MSKNPLFQLGPAGQSVWFDSISRSMVRSGRLQQLIDECAVVGVTSNPTILEQALSAGEEYDDEIRQLADAGLEPAAIFEQLAVDDIRAACDVLLPVYERTGGVDGRVSLEVSPRLAADAEGTLTKARRLWQQVARPNLMIKIPATSAGIAAVEHAIAEGISVNVTLLFAVSRYEQVMLGRRLSSEPRSGCAGCGARRRSPTRGSPTGPFSVSSMGRGGGPSRRRARSSSGRSIPSRPSGNPALPQCERASKKHEGGRATARHIILWMPAGDCGRDGWGERAHHHAPDRAQEHCRAAMLRSVASTRGPGGQHTDGGSPHRSGDCVLPYAATRNPRLLRRVLYH